MPHQIDKTALVMHSAERMFHLVNDVARYPEFLPWCAGAEVHEQNDAEIMASLDISKGGVRHRLTTDRKSTRLNSSHVKISYAVFCLKKKKKKKAEIQPSAKDITIYTHAAY